jgi:hypothetical protein
VQRALLIEKHRIGVRDRQRAVGDDDPAVDMAVHLLDQPRAPSRRRCAAHESARRSAR